MESTDNLDPIEIDEINLWSRQSTKKPSKISEEMAVETSAAQVKEKLQKGCECPESCFLGLKAENVFRHRLNVTELTREEHDMYLMGVTMACLANPSHTHRNRDRQRHRSSYVYQGKRVCLQAFLYLENVTRYHLKRIRHHVLNKGVVPRVHGNIGKKPHNTFSLDIYKCAERFIKEILASHIIADTNKPFILPGETRMGIYNKFKESALHPDGKVMGYTTFRRFLKTQFPNVRFANWPTKDCSSSGTVHQTKSQQRQIKKEAIKFSKKPINRRNINDHVQIKTRVADIVLKEDYLAAQQSYSDTGLFKGINIKDNDQGTYITECVLDEHAHESNVQTFYLTPVIA